MHNELKSMLMDTEVIWIYDEPNKCAIVQQIFKTGRVLYCAMVYFDSMWWCIGICETNVHGAQTMYECLKKVVKENGII